MSRGLWFVAGAASGVYALLKARRTAQALTPDGIASRIAAYRAGAQVFASAVAEGMAEREIELHQQLEQGVQLPRLIGPAPAQPALTPAAAAAPTSGASGAR